MPLQRFLDDLDQPAPQDLARSVISYMKDLPADQGELIFKCAEYLDGNMTRRGILTVAYALNGGEILLRCHDDAPATDSDELSREFERLLDDCKK